MVVAVEQLKVSFLRLDSLERSLQRFTPGGTKPKPTRGCGLNNIGGAKPLSKRTVHQHKNNDSDLGTVQRCPVLSVSVSLYLVCLWASLFIARKAPLLLVRYMASFFCRALATALPWLVGFNRLLTVFSHEYGSTTALYPPMNTQAGVVREIKQRQNSAQCVQVSIALESTGFTARVGPLLSTNARRYTTCGWNNTITNMKTPTARYSYTRTRTHFDFLAVRVELYMGRHTKGPLPWLFLYATPIGGRDNTTVEGEVLTRLRIVELDIFSKTPKLPCQR